nr:hypothetical protein [Streptomyces brasiliensis]
MGRGIRGRLVVLGEDSCAVDGVAADVGDGHECVPVAAHSLINLHGNERHLGVVGAHFGVEHLRQEAQEYFIRSVPEPESSIGEDPVLVPVFVGVSVLEDVFFSVVEPAVLARERLEVIKPTQECDLVEVAVPGHEAVIQLPDESAARHLRDVAGVPRNCPLLGLGAGGAGDAVDTKLIVELVSVTVECLTQFLQGNRLKTFAPVLAALAVQSAQHAFEDEQSPAYMVFAPPVHRRLERIEGLLADPALAGRDDVAPGETLVPPALLDRTDVQAAHQTADNVSGCTRDKRTITSHECTLNDPRRPSPPVPCMRPVGATIAGLRGSWGRRDHRHA